MRRLQAPTLSLPRRGEPPSTAFRVVTASLIAATSLLGAVGVWWSSEASGAAADAERRGFADLIAGKREETKIRSRLEEIVFDDLRARSYLEQARALRREAQRAAPDDVARLMAEAGARTGLARAVRAAIDRDALTPTGRLDLDRKFDIELTLTRERVDLDPAPEFARADDLGRKSEWLVGLAALLIGAAIFLTVAEATRTGDRRIYLGCGVGVLAAASTALVLVEMLA
jgi:hypothetical protein